MLSEQERSAAGCLCCANPTLTRQTTLVSGFLAERAWGGPPELTAMAFCEQCGFRFFDRGLSAEEAGRLYEGYRNEAYFRARNLWEPFYTLAQHQAVVAWARSPDRSEDLRDTLERAGLPSRFDYALDHGGNAGHMLNGVDAAQKVVYDPSGCDALPGISSISNPGAIPHGCDLLLSCQVLEHVSDPRGYLQDVAALCHKGAHLYIEVPDETWSNRVLHGKARDAWLKFLLRNRRLLILADTVSTGCRVKLGFLPPMGFIPMREHLNYFTIPALDALVRASGLEIVRSNRNGMGQLFAVART